MSSSEISPSTRRVVIVGGGAAGFFAAIRTAEVAKANCSPVEVVILEVSSRVLKKVKISGGGRCNVTHFCFEPKQFCQNYPRGSKELLSPFTQFQARDTVEWFRSRGIRLFAEEDGRMFPSSNESQTIIDCYLAEIKRYRIQLRTNCSVEYIKRLEGGRLSLRLGEDEFFPADAVMIATGSSPKGYRLAKQLGHSITDLAPSLFSFKIESPLLKDLSGLSFAQVSLKLVVPSAEGGKPKSFQQTGPMLVTHWGLSGPAVLKLSAWAARELKASDYRAALVVNWMGDVSSGQLENLLLQLKERQSKSQIVNASPEVLQKRFWQRLLNVLKIPEDRRWADISNKDLRRLTEALLATRLEVQGKNRYKDEFVECGGVSLKELDFKTMQSKLCPGLYFAGEILDIDGITGGFNFQNAWTTGWIAGSNMAGAKSNK